jgi:hypothetical protein
MDGHAPAARDSEARPVRLDPPKLAEQFAVRVAALALSTSARTIQSLPSRVTDLFFLLPYSLSGCATRFAGCARAFVPLSHRASASQSSPARRPRPAKTPPEPRCCGVMMYHQAVPSCQILKQKTLKTQYVG